MDFKELMVQRRSVRKYEQKPVDRILLECLAEAVRLAPSASNQQPWRLVFVDDSVLCLKVAELGLGTCMLGWFNEGRIKQLLGIPRNTGIGLVITIGWPAETVAASPRVKRRKDIDEVRTYNQY